MFTQANPTFDYFNLSPEICFLRDAEGIITSVNPAWTKYLGYSANEVIGKTLTPLIHPDDQEKNQENWKLLEFSSEGVSTSHEYRLRAKGGQYLWISENATILSRNSVGRASRVVAYAKDITDHKNNLQLLEIERNKSIMAFQMAAVGEMAGGIAHEINNPLSVIMARLYLLRDGVKKGKSTEQLFSEVDKIESTVQRISKIIRGLRFLSRNGQDDAAEYISLREVIEDGVELSRPRFQESGIELRVQEIPESYQLFCKPVQLAQVLVNLLNNAHDAVLHGSTRWVEVAWWENQSYLAIAIKDSGPGVPLSLRDKVMMPYFTTKDVGRGCGLGLSISKSIIEGHQGRLVLAEGAPHTTFLIELPYQNVKKIAI